MPLSADQIAAAAQISEIGAAIFQIPPVKVTLPQLHEMTSKYSVAEIASTVRKFDEQDLVRFDPMSGIIEPQKPGFAAFSENCVVDLILGRSFIMQKYRDAIVR